MKTKIFGFIFSVTREVKQLPDWEESKKFVVNYTDWGDLDYFGARADWFKLFFNNFLWKK